MFQEWQTCKIWLKCNVTAFSFSFHTARPGPQGHRSSPASRGTVSFHLGQIFHLLFIPSHIHNVLWSPASPAADSSWCNMSPPLSILQESKASFNSHTGNCSITLPFFVEGSNNLYATGVISSTHCTLVILQLWANDAITAGPHTFAPDADRITVRPTFRSIGHLHVRNMLAVGSTCAYYLGFFGKRPHSNLWVLSLIGIDSILRNKQRTKKTIVFWSI